MAKIGLQLYTVRDEAEKDFFGTIKKVAEVGYEGVEFAGYFGASSRELKKVLNETGLEAIGTTIPMHDLVDNKKLEESITYSKEINCPIIICPILPQEYRGSETVYNKAAEIFNSVGEKCNNSGLNFLYHIHGVEFENFNGKTGMEILMEKTDPKKVGFELDVYWVEYAGVDSVEYLKKYGKRCSLIHFKDMKDRVGKRDTEVGEGVIDVPALVNQAKKFNIGWYIVEQEEFDMPPMESIIISYKNLEKYNKCTS